MNQEQDHISEENKKPSNFTENTLEDHEAAEASSTGKSGLKKFFVFTAIVFAALLIVGFYLFGGSSAEKDKKTTLTVSSTPSANNSNPELENQLRDLRAQLNSNTNSTNSALTPNNPNQVNPNAIMNEPLQMPPTVSDQPIYNVSPIATPTPSALSTANNNGSSKAVSERSATESSKKVINSNESRSSDEPNPAFPLYNQRPAGPNPQKSVYLGNTSENLNKKSDVKSISPTSFVHNSFQKPPFNTLLPVRFLGASHSLASSAMVRMELVRAVQGSGYYLPRGTIVVGQISGNQYNRLFVTVNGYIDSSSNQLIALRGDLLGDDGAFGVIGERKRLNSRWRKVLGQVLDGAKQLGSAYLLGRRGGSGGIGFGQIGQIGQNGISALDSQNTAEFVMVRAGSFGYVLVNDLPPLKSVESAPVEDESLLGAINGQKPLTNDEMVSLLTQGDEAVVRREYPRMTPTMRSLADQMLNQR